LVVIAAEPVGTKGRGEHKRASLKELDILSTRGVSILLLQLSHNFCTITKIIVYSQSSVFQIENYMLI
ncbi:MAG: hypothetical protein R6V67_04425, partial [Spirochaetia bacterium]